MATKRPRRARSKHAIPMASIRYVDGTTREVPVSQLRLKHFTESEPWRRVRSVHGMAHYSGDYACATTGGQVVYESRLELARPLLADFDPAVCGIYAQPCRMVARVDGRVRSHVPDFLLEMRSGTVRVVDVKPASRPDDPKVVQALAWPGAADRAARLGVRDLVRGGADAPGEHRFLAGYRHPRVVPEDEVERAWRQVIDGEEMAIAERRLAGDRKPEGPCWWRDTPHFARRPSPWASPEPRSPGTSGCWRMPPASLCSITASVRSPRPSAAKSSSMRPDSCWPCSTRRRATEPSRTTHPRRGERGRQAQRHRTGRHRALRHHHHMGLPGRPERDHAQERNAPPPCLIGTMRRSGSSHGRRSALSRVAWATSPGARSGRSRRGNGPPARG